MRFGLKNSKHPCGVSDWLFLMQKISKMSCKESLCSSKHKNGMSVFLREGDEPCARLLQSS